MLTKEQIKSCVDAGPLKVEIPEWGGDIYVKRLSGIERDRLERELAKHQDSEDDNISARAFYAVHFVCDEQGNSMFESADMEWLQHKFGFALDRIVIAARKHNGLTAEAVDELEKN